MHTWNGGSFTCRTLRSAAQALRPSCAPMREGSSCSAGGGVRVRNGLLPTAISCPARTCTCSAQCASTVSCFGLTTPSNRRWPARKVRTASSAAVGPNAACEPAGVSVLAPVGMAATTTTARSNSVRCWRRRAAHGQQARTKQGALGAPPRGAAANRELGSPGNDSRVAPRCDHACVRRASMVSQDGKSLIWVTFGLFVAQCLPFAADKVTRAVERACCACPLYCTGVCN